MLCVAGCLSDLDSDVQKYRHATCREDYSDLSHDFAAKKELGGAYLTCPALVQNNNQLAYLDTVLIDPYYYRYAVRSCSWNHIAIGC